MKEKCKDEEIDTAMASACPPVYECDAEGLAKAMPATTSFRKMDHKEQRMCFDDSSEGKMAVAESVVQLLKKQCGRGKGCSKCLLWDGKEEELSELLFAARCDCKASDVRKALNNEELLRELPVVCGLAGVDKASNEDLAEYVSKKTLKKCSPDHVAAPAAMFCTKIQNDKCDLDKAADEIKKVGADDNMESVCALSTK